MDAWHLVRSEPAGAAWNMAVDEALLLTASVRPPVLRFYGWAEPAASFGYFQRHAEIAGLTGLRPLVRRPTGGGLVEHARDWTYSLAIPAGHPWHRLRAELSYQRLHEWLRASFGRLGLETVLAPAPHVEGPGRCFVGAERHDLLWHGRKLAGAAQRRNRSGLLIQGSVQPPPSGIERTRWEEALCAAAAEQWGVRWEPLEPSAGLSDEVERLMAVKYGTAAYHSRR